MQQRADSCTIFPIHMRIKLLNNLKLGSKSQGQSRDSKQNTVLDSVQRTVYIAVQYYKHVSDLIH